MLDGSCARVAEMKKKHNTDAARDVLNFIISDFTIVQLVMKTLVTQPKPNGSLGFSIEMNNVNRRKIKLNKKSYLPKDCFSVCFSQSLVRAVPALYILHTFQALCFPGNVSMNLLLPLCILPHAGVGMQHRCCAVYLRQKFDAVSPLGDTAWE